MKATVAVTGAASGLGREIASDLLTRGWSVVLLDRDAEALNAVSAEFDARHEPSVWKVVSDLSTTEGIRAAARELAVRPRLGGLVNNAGGWLPGDQYPEATPETWLTALTVNLVAPMLLTQLLWPTLAANDGAVVNVGSTGGIGDSAYGSPEYAAAKAGIRRFTSSLSMRTDVRVMAVVPGWIGLDRAHAEWAALSMEQQRDSGALIPPGDIAAVVATLLTDGKPGEVIDVLRKDKATSTQADET